MPDLAEDGVADTTLLEGTTIAGESDVAVTTLAPEVDALEVESITTEEPERRKAVGFGEKQAPLRASLIEEDLERRPAADDDDYNVAATSLKPTAKAEEVMSTERELTRDSIGLNSDQYTQQEASRQGRRRKMIRQNVVAKS